MIKADFTLSQLPQNIKTHVVNQTLYMTLYDNILNVDTSRFNVPKIFTGNIKNLKITTEHLGQWDDTLLIILYKALLFAKARNIGSDISSLPLNLQKLINLAFVSDHKLSNTPEEKYNFLETIGYKTSVLFTHIKKDLKYISEVLSAIVRGITGKSLMRPVDFLSALNDCGPQAMGIVILISFLIGLILAFVGVVQLQNFGAQVYVASLVTIGMCRIMGAIMVGIIIAGRTGASYAATLGAMQVNEELDALATMGISRIDFLVLPRVLALLLSMPILTIVADFFGILGGGFVGIVIMQIPASEYWRYAINAFSLNNFLIGIFHSVCFGFIIALCGCYSGLICNRSANGVGQAATSAVVNAIVWMIVVTGIITVICQELKI